MGYKIEIHGTHSATATQEAVKNETAKFLSALGALGSDVLSAEITDDTGTYKLAP